jgi:hypothetical protein
MKELFVHPQWRYTPIQPGDKRPLMDEWQLHPVLIQDMPSVPDECNIGLLLGPESGGVVAMDFDGEEAWDYWSKTFDFDPPETVGWTSGKELRMQLLYSVPQDFWPMLKKKVINKLEFRWTGGQSVLPPSKLDDGRQYTWLNKPSTTPIAPLPLPVIDNWLSIINRAHEAPKLPDSTVGLNNYALQRLHALGCIYRKNGRTINLWHHTEQTRGGWYVFTSNPLWVNHNGHKSMRLDQWIRTYWYQQTNIAMDYRKQIVQELKAIRKGQ